MSKIDSQEEREEGETGYYKEQGHFRCGTLATRSTKKDAERRGKNTRETSSAITKTKRTDNGTTTGHTIVKNDKTRKQQKTNNTINTTEHFGSFIVDTAFIW